MLMVMIIGSTERRPRGKTVLNAMILLFLPTHTHTLMALQNRQEENERKERRSGKLINQQSTTVLAAAAAAAAGGGKDNVFLLSSL